jgi:hypothetical protein
MYAPTDAVLALEDFDVDAARLQLRRGVQARKARPMTTTSWRCGVRIR